MGRPAKPLEHHRQVGRNGTTKADGRPLPELASITLLRMAEGVPDRPDDLGEPGIALWNRAWAAAVTWLSPDTDRDAIEHAARMADNLAVARRRYMATTEPADARAVVALSGEFSKALARIGFDPTARATLGVAEVRTQSELEKIRTNQAKRDSG